MSRFTRHKTVLALLLTIVVFYTCGCGHQATYDLGSFNIPLSTVDSPAELVSTGMPELIGRPIAGGYPLSVSLNLAQETTYEIPKKERFYEVNVTRTSGSKSTVDNPFEFLVGVGIVMPVSLAFKIISLGEDDSLDKLLRNLGGYPPQHTSTAQDNKAIGELRSKILKSSVKNFVEASTGSTYRGSSKYLAKAHLKTTTGRNSRSETSQKPLPSGVKVQLRSGSKVLEQTTDSTGTVSFQIAGDRKSISELSGMVMDILVEHDGNMESMGKIRLSQATIKDSLAMAEKTYMDMTGTPSLPPRGLVSVKVDPSVTAGEKCNITVTIENVGKGEFYRLKGVIQSSDPAFNGIEFPVGRLDPGDSRTITRSANIPLGHSGGEAVFRLKWTEYNDYYPDPASAKVTLESLDRPKFATRIQVMDDGSGNSVGNSDGRIQKGEAVDLLVTVKNVGQGVARNVKVRLDGTSGIRGLKGVVTTADIGELKPNASQKCRLTVSTTKSVRISELNASLNITDSYFDISSTESVNLPINKDLKKTVMVYRSKRYVGDDRIAIHSGADVSTSVIANAEPGTTLDVTGELDNWLRIEIQGVGSGWVDKTKVLTNRVTDTPAVAAKPDGGIITVLENTGPMLFIVDPGRESTSKKPQITVSGMAADDRNIARVAVSLNGIEQSEITGGKAIGIAPDSQKPLVTSSGGKECNFHFPLVLKNGANEIEVTAWDDDGLSSTKSCRVIYEQATGDIYLVAIGIDNYMHVTPDLKYATEDAVAVAECFKRNLGVPQDNIKVLLDEEATSSAIRYWVGDKMRRSAGKEDTVIIYFSGHGAPEADPTSPDNDGIEKFILPVEADQNALFSTAIRMEDIRQFFRRIRSERVIFLVDSCYSGMAGGRSLSSGSTFRSIDQGRLLDRLKNTGRGRVIITSSSGNEVSQEKPSLGHGVFTFYLVQGLDGAADSNANGEVTIDELFSYVSREVSRETGNAQHPLKALVEDVDGEVVVSMPSAER